MKYLEKSLKFLSKNYLLAIPIFLTLLIPALMVESATDGVTSSVKDSIENIVEIGENLEDMQYYFNDYEDLYNFLVEDVFEDVFEDIASLIKISMQAAFLGFVLGIVTKPMTYGLVNRGLDKGTGKLQDAGTNLGENIVKYFIFIIGRAVLWLLIFISTIISLLIIGVIASKAGDIGMYIILVSVVALILFSILIAVISNLWYPAMVIEDLGVVEGFKKAFSIGKSKFWTLLGISILVAIASAVGGFIFGLFTFVPYLGTVLAKLIPAAASFIMITFYIMVYRDKVGLVIEQPKNPPVENISDNNQ